MQQGQVRLTAGLLVATPASGPLNNLAGRGQLTFAQAQLTNSLENPPPSTAVAPLPGDTRPVPALDHDQVGAGGPGLVGDGMLVATASVATHAGHTHIDGSLQ